MTEEELRQLYPYCFNDQRKPLALGIHANMGIKYPDKTMFTWVTHPRYLRNQLVPGAVRVDLTGNTVGTVTQEERERAWRALLDVRGWIYRQRSHPSPRWLSFSPRDEAEEMKQRMPKFPKSKE